MPKIKQLFRRKGLARRIVERDPTGADADDFGQGGSGLPELPPSEDSRSVVGGVFQRLASGVRFTLDIDGGNAAGLVALPASGWTPPVDTGGGSGGGSGPWTLTTNFVFGESAPTTNNFAF